MKKAPGADVTTDVTDHPAAVRQEALAMVRLPAPRHAGDVFWSQASRYGIQFNHVGMFSAINQVTEAPGLNQVTHAKARTDTFAVDPKRGEVERDQATRNRAASWTLSHLNKPYNTVFFKNKDIETDHYNCSQFAWAAYKKFGPDLDGNGGLGVYPDDLLRDNDITWY